MAKCAFLLRINGRYYFQKRLRAFGRTAGSLVRISLRTTNYRVAAMVSMKMALIVDSAEQFTDVASRTSHILTQMKIENFAFANGQRCSLSARRALENLGGKCMAELRASLRILEGEFGTDDVLDAYAQISEREKEALELYHAYEDIWHQFVTDSIRFDDDLVASTLPRLAERAPKRSWPDLEQAPDETAWSNFLEQFLAAPAPLMPVQLDTVIVHDAPVVSQQHEPPVAKIDTHSIEEQPVAAPGILLPEVVEEYFSYQKSQCGDDRVRGVAGLPLQFMIDLCGDRDIASYTRDDFQKVEKALPEVPLLNGIPKQHRKSMYSRYLYCQSVKKKNCARIGTVHCRSSGHGQKTRTS